MPPAIRRSNEGVVAAIMRLQRIAASQAGSAQPGTRTCTSGAFSSKAIRVVNLARFIGKRD